MRCTVFSLLLVVSTACAAPLKGLLEITRVGGPVKAGSYIVKFKNDADAGTTLSSMFQPQRSAKSPVTASWQRDVFNGFAGNFDDVTLRALRSLPDVEYIIEDSIVHTQAVTTQTNAPWGLARFSQSGRLANQNAGGLNFSYRYDSTAGAGVDIYIIDTGINVNHTDFGGRARWGATFGRYRDADGNGHGTHCAGTAAGSRYGVAKAANLIAVKALSDEGSGAVSDIMSGLDFVLNSARTSGNPTVASMSLGGGASRALDNAVTNLINAGIHVIAAAGNSNVNAANTSPARAPGAITVGASTIADAKASFSNFGAVVDIWAPGQNIISTYIGSNTATAALSGTSMAAPHVAGFAAYLIGLEGNLDPSALVERIHALGTDGTLRGVPSDTNNELVRNDIA